MTYLLSYKKSHGKGQGQPDIHRFILSQFLTTSTFTSFLYEVTHARRAIVQWVVLKEQSFHLIEDSYCIEMIREGFSPTFQSFSGKTCQCDFLHHMLLKCKINFLF